MPPSLFKAPLYKLEYEGRIDNPLSQNLYTYVHNNPLIYTDPAGYYIIHYDKGGSGGFVIRYPRKISTPKSSVRIKVPKSEVEALQAETRSLWAKAAPEGTGNLIDSSPIKIPSNSVKVEQAKKGYYQVKYTWSDGTYKYEARWHTRTPGAPADQGDTWLVTRKHQEAKQQESSNTF